MALDYLNDSLGTTWLRRGLQNFRCMSWNSDHVKPTVKLIVANDDNYALAA